MYGIKPQLSFSEERNKIMLNAFSTIPLNRRRFIGNSAFTLGTIAGAGTLLGACNANASSASDKTTLTVMYASNELTKAYISEFEKLNSDIAIKFIEFDQTRLNAMLVANTPPDFVRGTGIDSPRNAAREIALNLDPYIEKSKVLKKDDFLPVQDLWRWDGKQVGQGPYYGLVKDWSQDGTLWANDTLFQQAGLSPLSETEPISYDEFLAIGHKLLKKSGSKIQVYGIDPQWAGATNIFQMILQQGGSVFSADLTQADFATPEAVKALQWYVDYGQAHVGPSPFDPDPNGWDGPTYVASRLAVTQSGYWFGGQIATGGNDVKSSARLVPAPQMGSKRISACFSGTGAWIPANAKNKDAAWKFMEYFMAGTPAHDRAKGGWGVPALKSLLPEMPQQLPYQKQAYQTLQKEFQYLQVLKGSPYAAFSGMNTIIDKYLQQAVKKQMSVSAAAQQITKDINALLAQGKQALS
jgi:multiple sugar transport system substrate-binding protein